VRRNVRSFSWRLACIIVESRLDFFRFDGVIGAGRLDGGIYETRLSLLTGIVG
jgi:hypothetical protein